MKRLKPRDNPESFALGFSFGDNPDVEMASRREDCRVVFVGGVHGVGKTSLCRRLATELSGAHVSASSLIADPGRVGRLVENLEENQRLLVRGFRAYECTSPLLLLDGHFALATKDGSIQPVPTWTFREIGPSALILLTAPTSTIHARLLVRDRTEMGLEQLAALEAEEVASANHVATTLGIPIRQISELDDLQYGDAVSFLRQLPVSPSSK